MGGFGGADLVVSAMKASPKNATLQSLGCFVLMKLADKDQYQRRIGELGGVDLMLSVMQGHLENTGLLRSACGALQFLLLDQENSEVMWNADGCALVEQMMR